MADRRWWWSLLLAVLTACASDVTDPIASPQPANNARVRIVVPEVYELANIIIAMTTYGQGSLSLVYKNSDYYSRVNTAFGPYRNSTAMSKLQLGADDPIRHYYEMINNAFAYVYESDQIKRDPAYGSLAEPNLFRERLASVQQFADESHFRAFYASNADFYKSFLAQYHALAEIDSIADWLEREFAPRKYDHYTVALSPLVYGSHSTQNAQTPSGSEAIMFVSGPYVTSDPSTSAGVQKATIQRIVFTEIDHNFVNPVTSQYDSQVRTAFGTRSKWTTDNSSFYDNPVSVFNEYMTWGVFLLYIEPRVNQADFDEISRLTTQLMEGGRKFQKFGAFSLELLRLYHAGGQHVPQLYPAMLDWATRQ